MTRSSEKIPNSENAFFILVTKNPEENEEGFDAPEGDSNDSLGVFSVVVSVLKKDNVFRDDDMIFISDGGRDEDSQSPP
jgi:hypothetical protein